MQRQLNGKGRRDGDSMAMDEQRERNGGVGAAGGGSDKGQHSIKT